MLVTLWSLSLAWATPSSATSEEWALAEATWWVHEPIVLEARTGAVRLDRGFVFRVDDGEGPVGLAFVGEATWTVRFEAPSQAERFANRRVLAEGDDPADLRAAVDEGVWTTDVERGLLFGVDVWPAVAPSVLEVRRHRGALISAEPGRIEEVIVNAHMGLAAARQRARQALDRRLEDLRANAFDPAAWVALDRLEGCRADAACNRLAELETDHRWDRFAGADFVGASGTWLTWVADPRGLLDLLYAEEVLARAVDSQGARRQRTVATASFPPDVLGVPRAPHRVDLHEARAMHLLTQEDVRLAQTSAVDLQVRAVGGPAQAVVIDVPHVHQQPFIDQHPLPNGFELLGVETPDGEPLDGFHLPLTPDQREGRGSARTVWVRLPRELAEDEVATVRVRYRDHHRYARYWEFESNGVAHIYGVGHGATLPAIPRVRSHNGAPPPAHVGVGLLGSRKDHVTLSGDLENTWEEGGWRWFRGASRFGEDFRISVSRARPRTAPAVAGLPAITAAMQPGRAELTEGVQALVRQGVLLHRAALHDLPLSHVHVVEVGSNDRAPAIGGASDRMITYLPHWTEIRTPQLSAWSASAVLIGLHEQWWLPTGAGRLDSTPMVHTGAAFSWLFLVHTEADTMRAELEDRVRRHVEEAGLTALSDAPATLLGAYVLGESLRARVGEAALLEGIDRTLLGQVAPTWDGLQEALEYTSGQDLDDFFAVWVHGGHAPRVSLTWEIRDATLRASLLTDLPFGRLTVPVQVGDTLHQVVLVDGAGTLEVPAPPVAAPPVIDPGETLLFAGTRVTRGLVDPR